MLMIACCLWKTCSDLWKSAEKLQIPVENFMFSAKAIEET
jgi:hypothetical protein